MTEIYSSTNQEEILVLKSMLLSVGINSEIYGEHINDLYPCFQPMSGGIRLLVSEENFNDAIEVVQDFKKNTSAGRELE